MGWLTNLSNSWFSGSFLHAAYVLPAVLLVSVPIIIHFINRMRYRRVKWAAMEFLLASQKRNRRRLLLEQLLLLLLRVLAVLGIIFLIARPVLDASQLSLFQGQKTHHVVLLDDSGSMRERRGEKTVFDGALEVVAKIVAEGARRPGTQTLTLVPLSNVDQPVFVVRNLDPEFQKEFERRIKSLECSHRSLDLAAGINACARILQSQKGAALNFHLISDFRDQDWSEAKAVTQALQAVSKAGSSLNLVRATPQGAGAGTGNIGVTDLSGNVEVAAANVPLRLRVSVKNFSDQVQQNLQASVWADGEKLPVTIPFERLEVGQEASREFDVVFARTGDHVVRVSLPPDPLGQDNDRYLAVRVPEVNPVLIVANEASNVVQDLQDALAPAPGLTGFAPQVQNAEFLRRNSLEKFQAVFVLDVPQLHPDAARTLETFVESGGGLCWYVGPRINVSYYNDRLYRPGFGIGAEEPTPSDTFRKRDANSDGKVSKSEFVGTATAEAARTLGEAFSKLDRNSDQNLTLKEFSAPRNGLFPLKLGSIATLAVDEADPAPDIEFTKHPLFTMFTASGEDNPFVATVKVTRYFAPATGWLPDDGVRVIARLRNNSPLFLEHRYGRGTVVTCLTSCRDWSNWATVPPAFVVLQLEIEKHIARSQHALDRRIVGEPIRTRLDPAVYKSEVTVLLPDGKTEKRTAVPETQPAPNSQSPGAGTPSPNTPVAAANSVASMYVDEFRGTDPPGVYGLIRSPLAGGDETERFAYNVPASESRLQVIATERMRKSLGAGLPLTIQEFENFQWISGKQAGTELHEIVLYVLLAVLLFEQLMAFRLSFHPKRGAAA